MDDLKDAIRYCKSIYRIEANDTHGHFDQIKKWLEELRDIKILQKKERNLTLPCNVGDRIYVIEPLWMYDDNRWQEEKFHPIHKLKIRELYVERFVIERSGISAVADKNLYISIDKFGRDTFTDPDEAKKVMEKAVEVFEKNNVHFKEG